MATIANLTERVSTLIRSADEMVVTTNSGTRYHIHHVGGRRYDVLRIGVEGRKTFHPEVGIKWDRVSNTLVVGPWHTTGLREIEVLSAR